jgi:hypothetical protein
LKANRTWQASGTAPLEQTKGHKASVYAVSNCLAAGNTDSEYYAQSREALHESKIFKATAIIYTFAKNQMFNHRQDEDLPDVLDEAVNKCLAVDNTNAEDMLETRMFAPLKNLMAAKKDNALQQVFDLLQSAENPGEKMREVATLVCDDLHQHLQKQSQSAEFDDNDAYCMAPGR